MGLNSHNPPFQGSCSHSDIRFEDMLLNSRFSLVLFLVWSINNTGQVLYTIQIVVIRILLKGAALCVTGLGTS